MSILTVDDALMLAGMLFAAEGWVNSMVGPTAHPLVRESVEGIAKEMLLEWQTKGEEDGSGEPDSE